MTDTSSYSAKARSIQAAVEVGEMSWIGIEEILTLIGTEREAIGYEKGKEEAAKKAQQKSIEYTEASISVDDARVKSVLEMQAIACGFVESAIRALPLPPKGK